MNVLAAPSGPWPEREGMGMAPPPVFAESISEPFTQAYLKPIRLAQNRQVAGNRPSNPGVYLEIRLKDGKETLRFPDPEAKPWLRDWQQRFVQGLVPDQPVAPPQGEFVPAPGQQVRTVPIWDLAPGGSLRLKRVPEHLIPRNREVFGPTEWSLVLVQSLGRHFCREHGSASVEILRHSRDPLSAAMLTSGGSPPAAFNDLIANFGEIRGEPSAR
jgi:hypothetical protein